MLLRVEVLRTASESTVARMIDDGHAGPGAEGSPRERFSAWFGQRYTVAVLAGAGDRLRRAGLLIGREFGDCALPAPRRCSSPPAPVPSSSAYRPRSSRRSRPPHVGGVLFKGGAALESFGAIRQFAFDKTGTLTQGRAQVVDVLPLGMAQ